MIKDVIIPYEGRAAAAIPCPEDLVLFAPSPRAWRRFLEFFTATISNRNTRRAYMEAVREFARWDGGRFDSLSAVEPIHIAAYIEQLQTRLARPSVKLHLAALRRLFDWLVTGQVLAANPAASVRGPKYSARKGKTPVLTREETRRLLDSIDTASLTGARDRALIALMVYSFARVGAALAMTVADFYIQGGRGWVRLHEKGGKRHELPCHPELEAALSAWISRSGLGGAQKAPLFPALAGRTGRFSGLALTQPAVFRMIQRRTRLAGITTRIGCHTFRATGITAYLKSGGRLEIAQQMANHESPRTTSLYDRRGDDLTLSEVERIRF